MFEKIKTGAVRQILALINDNFAKVNESLAKKLDNDKPIDISIIPTGALDRLVAVTDKTAMFALTIDDVQKGDSVQTMDTGVMYRVIDDTNLSNETGYKEYTAGRASSVPWSGVADKPIAYPPTEHTHDYGTLTGLPTLLDIKTLVFTDTSGEWGAINNGVYSLTIATGGKTVVLGVYNSTGIEVLVDTVISGTNVIVYSPVKFTGSVKLI